MIPPEVRRALDALDPDDPVRALAAVALDPDTILAAAALRRIAEECGGSRAVGTAASQENVGLARRPRG